MNKRNVLLIGGALGVAFYVWQHRPRATKPGSPPTQAQETRALLHELSRLHAANTRNAKRSKERDDLVPVVSHYRSYPGTSLLPR